MHDQTGALLDKTEGWAVSRAPREGTIKLLLEFEGEDSKGPSDDYVTSLSFELPMLSQGSQPLHWHFAYASLEDWNFQIHGQTLFFIVVVFSIILLIDILILYARWIYSFRPLLANVTSTLHHASPSQPHGLNVATINNLPIMLHPILGRDKVSEAECCICLGMFQVGEEIVLVESFTL
ncbi:hypothetical protein RJ640_013391 [Escallonia rubra]|uniref:Uncharacterized protein n=1 Tax=Escallonia rubra TaxID=112253 RepID=A0AA88U5Z1_9ASTE|nr:hypothetical protein RJ640_013391 [Escallonia rubra]